MQIKQLTSYLERIAPPALQESYDNAGLIIGTPNTEIKGVLISLDLTEAVLDEALAKGFNLIITHHPIIFRGIKKLNGKNYAERCVMKALKHDIAIYAAHTNLDNVIGGVNGKIADLLGLQDVSVLKPTEGRIRKIITFVPEAHADKVRAALFEAGAGRIGNYDGCSYNTEGFGTFRAGENTNPFVGKKGQVHHESEVRIETVFPDYLQSSVIQALYEVHPYEEPAYDIYKLQNSHKQTGAGIIGQLKTETDAEEFLLQLKQVFDAGCIRHTAVRGKRIKTVALCGGAGSFLLPVAKARNADIFISGDFKYHEFFDAENQIIIADVGHYESEQFTKNLFYELITKKFSNFACSISEINTNPINYL